MLNIRVIYRLLGKTEVLVSAGFALTFFVTRIILFGALVLHILTQYSQLALLLSWPLQISYFGLLPAVYGLNWFWFLKICQGIARVLRGEKDGSSDGYTRDDENKRR